MKIAIVEHQQRVYRRRKCSFYVLPRRINDPRVAQKYLIKRQMMEKDDIFVAMRNIKLGSKRLRRKITSLARRHKNKDWWGSEVTAFQDFCNIIFNLGGQFPDPDLEMSFNHP